MELSVTRSLLRLLNPVRLYRAVRDGQREGPPRRGAVDPELHLYARVLGHGHLHYGFFEDTELRGEEISLADLRRAQKRYSRLLLDELRDHDRPVLDCGCGMGGFLELLSDRDYRAVGITPDAAQFEFIERTLAGVEVRRTKFEELDTRRYARAFGTIVCSESMQYLELEPAFGVAGEILAPGGRWIVCDYFRKRRETHEGSGHLLEAFLEAVEAHGWTVRTERDITANVMGTLRYAHAMAEEIGRPLVAYLLEKFRVKRSVLYELFREEVGALEARLDREMRTVDPAQFRRDKTYRLFVLERA